MTGNHPTFVCTAVLITKRFLLSAKHCFFHGSPSQEIDVSFLMVRLGVVSEVYLTHFEPTTICKRLNLFIYFRKI